MVEFIFCPSCQHYRALPDGPKTPAGKPICSACYELFLKRKAKAVDRPCK